MTPSPFQPCPEVYLLTASRARLSASPEAEKDLQELQEDLRTEGFLPQAVHAPDDAATLPTLVEALPLAEMASNRGRLVAVIYWLSEWEGRTSGNAPLFPGINASNSVIRNVLIQRFRGLPFLIIDVDTTRLAKKWSVELQRAQRQGGKGPYFAEKFGAAMRELNQGMLLSPFRDQLRRPLGDFVSRIEHDRLLGRARAIGIRPATLDRALAQAFPEGEPVEVLKCMGGMSGALVFVAKTLGSAPKLVKLCNWHAAQCEYEGARFVIGPRLTNFAAVAITPGNDTGPSLFTEGSGADARALGLLVYSIVGTPGGQLNIRSLNDLLGELRDEPAKVDRLLPRLEKTLAQVLGQLHGEKPQVVRRTLWGWLGANLPPLFSLDLGAGEGQPMTVVPAYAALGFKADAAALLAEATWRTINPADFIELHGALVTGVTDEAISVAHPDLGFRLTCRGNVAACLKHADYLKVGHPVRVRGRIGLERLPWAERVADSTPAGVVCPNNPFAPTSLPFSLTFEGRAGAIHGDLNLDNLHFSDETNLGWLIDFDRSDEDGMIAFDFAKLEIELLSHHLIPAVHWLGETFPDLVLSCPPRASAEILMESVLRSLDAFHGSPNGILALWRTMAQEKRIPLERFEGGSLAHLEALLQVLAVIRARANRLLRSRSQHEEAPPDLALALSCYALVAVKFAERAGHLERIPYLRQTASHYWGHWGFDASSKIATAGNLDTHCRSTRGADLQVLDRFLLDKTQDTSRFADMVTLWRGIADSLVWHQAQEAWDFASTGCVANISPIMGYLWLMCRRTAGQKLIVPKISSKGRSCGTVDILESGGYRFPDNPERIRKAVEQFGGVFCKQEESMVRVDRFTMERRKKRNLMKNPTLVVASILAKKALMGCTHAVIDVKVGRDTKFILRDNAKTNEIVCPSRARHKELIPGAEVFDEVKAVFESLLSDSEFVLSPQGLLRCKSKAPDSGIAGTAIKDLRVICTSADVPQGRAIGRLLILLQLDTELQQDQPFNAWPERYRRLYLEVVKQACDVEEGLRPKALGVAWAALKRHLPVFDPDKGHENSGVLAAMREAVASPDLNLAHPLLVGRGGEHDVHVLSFSLCKAGTVSFTDAYALDRLFDALCGDDEYDPAVGFWLHRLPGERSDGKEPFLSVFFRPAVMSERTLRRRIAGFLESAVSVEVTDTVTPETTPSLRCLTWNIQWAKGEDGRVDLERIAEVIRSYDADIVCLQEVCRNFPGNTGDSEPDQVAGLRRRFRDYASEFGAATNLRTNGQECQFGNLILTRLPVLSVAPHLLPRPAVEENESSRAALELVLKGPWGPLRLINAHLEYASASQRLAQVDYLLARHREACAWARRPIERKPECDETPLRTVPRTATTLMCGDFNAQPHDPAVKRLVATTTDDSAPLFDAWRYLYPERPHPPTLGLHTPGRDPMDAVCFDYFLLTEDLAGKVRSVTTDPDCRASDHQPLLLILGEDPGLNQ